MLAQGSSVYGLAQDFGALLGATAVVVAIGAWIYPARGGVIRLCLAAFAKLAYTDCHERATAQDGATARGRPTVRFAAERTLLAWMRTGLAILVSL